MIVSFAATAVSMISPGTANSGEPAWLSSGDFHWKISRPLVEPAQYESNSIISVKDPSIVYHDDRWHLFCTLRGEQKSHQVEYITFKDWNAVDRAERHLILPDEQHFCAPQVFYFTPHKKWYMICQASNENWDPKYGAAFSTNDDIADPDGWTPLSPVGQKLVDGKKSGLDFWVICDEEKAHLFFTTNDGRMWREETPIDQFPFGWSEPELAIRGDIFEAGHIYRLRGLDQYLTIIEAQRFDSGTWRYYKAYVADTLDGQWRPLAATREKAFADIFNGKPEGDHWTDSISHAEMIRTGADEHLEVDPDNLQCVFQGVSNADRAGKAYGAIPWRLGLITLDHGDPTESDR